MADTATRSQLAWDAPTRVDAAVGGRPRLPAGGPALTSAGAAHSASSTTVTINRRDRLRDFQTGLADKLRRAQGAPLAVNRLGVQIGERRLLVDLADAGEILAVPEIVPVPLTKAWYRGLANVRGTLLGVVDLSLFAGGPPTPLDKESRVLAFATELQFSSGLLISRMLGLRSAADLVADAATDAPADLFAPWVRARLTDGQDVRWQELDLAALTADPRFLDIARA